MGLLFNRRAAILIRSTTISGGKTISIAGEGKIISDLRMNFQIEKTSQSDANTAKISISNLTEESRSLLEKGQLDKKATAGSYINFSVGYNDEFEEVFQGNVQKAVTKKQGPTFFTEIEAGDGDFVLRKSQFNKTFKEGAGLRQIVSDVVSSMGLETGNLSDLPDTKFLSATSYSGLSRDILNKIMKKVDLDWSIQNGIFKISVDGNPTKEPVVKLTSSTGMIGSPNKTDKGIEIVSLIQPKFVPKNRIVVESDKISGTFVINKVIHSGDTHGNDWFSKLECTEAAGS